MRLKDGYNSSLALSKFASFNPDMLDLGDVTQDGVPVDALAAVFDLAGFTTFCNQTDPHLVMPEYLSTFLDWLFTSISDQFFQKQRKTEIVLWCQLPFYAKFLGDGILFLWDTKDFEFPILYGNVVESLRVVCENYQTDFLPEVARKVSKPPSKLRCGIARGRIISVGDGEDFVGPCINVASKIQKLGQFSFAISRRGFDLETCFAKAAHNTYALITSPVAGLGDEELLFVLKKEFRKLPPKERKRLAR